MVNIPLLEKAFLHLSPVARPRGYEQEKGFGHDDEMLRV
jgi:hypothetical protein